MRRVLFLTIFFVAPAAYADRYAALMADAQAAADQGNSAGALQRWQEALAEAQKGADPRQVGWAAESMATALILDGRATEAVALLEQAEAAYAKAGDHQARLGTLQKLIQADPPRAQTHQARYSALQSGRDPSAPAPASIAVAPPPPITPPPPPPPPPDDDDEDDYDDDDESSVLGSLVVVGSLIAVGLAIGYGLRGDGDSVRVELDLPGRGR